MTGLVVKVVVLVFVLEDISVDVDKVLISVVDVVGSSVASVTWSNLKN